MKDETLYELLQDFVDPCGSIGKGVRKTEHQWMARFALLNPGDCDIKTDWFKKVSEPNYTEEDMVKFARYILRKRPLLIIERLEECIKNRLEIWEEKNKP